MGAHLSTWRDNNSDDDDDDDEDDHDDDDDDEEFCGAEDDFIKLLPFSETA